MPVKGMFVQTHEVEGNVSLATLSTTFVPYECGWYFEVALVGGESPANGCAHSFLKPLLLCWKARRTRGAVS